MTERVPPDLHLIFRATRLARGVVAAVARHPVSCLSWDSFGAVCPSADIPGMRPLPEGNRASNQLTRGPSSWFRTTSTVCPHTGFRACCIPVPARVRSVSASRRPLPPGSTEVELALVRKATGHPRYALHTPRRSPPDRSRTHVAVSPCPLVVRPASFRRTTPTLDLEALLRCRVRSSDAPLPVRRSPLLPWAWFPSRVLARPKGPTRCVSTSARALSLRRCSRAVASASARLLRGSLCRAAFSATRPRLRSRSWLAEAYGSVCPERSVCIRRCGPSWGF
jgi:hypothetical protein